MTLATIQHLRSFTYNEHPVSLEPGQIGFNVAAENIDNEHQNANIFLYVGNGSDLRIDETGTVLVDGSANGRGWIRYSLRSVSVEGDSIYGNLDVIGAQVRISRSAENYAELIIPKETDTPSSGTDAGSIRWNGNLRKLQAWDGVKWDNTSKVTVSDIAPPNPSNGDMWLTTTPVPTFYVYVVPGAGPASWVNATSGGAGTALQPGNGITANGLNQIDIIDQGPF